VGDTPVGGNTIPWPPSFKGNSLNRPDRGTKTQQQLAHIRQYGRLGQPPICADMGGVTVRGDNIGETDVGPFDSVP
jgi:hypothetical protein